MKPKNLKSYFDNIYSSDLNILTVPVIDLEKDQEKEKPLLSCMGRDIDLHANRTTRKAAKWFLREVSDRFYKCQLGHCDSTCLCKRSRSGVNIYWRFFDIAEHPEYSQLESELRQHFLYKEAGILLEGNGYEQIIKFACNDKNKEKLENINQRISEYLIDQLLVDYAYQETNEFTDQKYNITLYEYEDLISIAKERHKNNQPLSHKLQSFLVEKIQGKKLKGSDSTKPRIGNGSIDYRIMFMIKEQAEKQGFDSTKLDNNHKVITDVCKEINEWGYFSPVRPTAEKVPKDCCIKAVRERYFAKHPS